MRTFLKNWFPVIAWIGLIFVGSTDLMSAEHTSRFIAPLLRWLVPDISAHAMASVQLVVRKAAHLTEYAILAALLLRAVAARERAIAHRDLAITIAIAAGCAAFDEYHQSFVPTRTAASGDVLIDTCGAILGAAISAWMSSRKGSDRS